MKAVRRLNPEDLVSWLDLYIMARGTQLGFGSRQALVHQAADLVRHDCHVTSEGVAAQANIIQGGTRHRKWTTGMLAPVSIADSGQGESRIIDGEFHHSL